MHLPGAAAAAAAAATAATVTGPANIIVVGGGIVGASIAWHLASHDSGPNVTVIAEQFGGVATPNSFAWINAATEDKTYYDFRIRSIERWMEISKMLPDLPIHWSGALGFDKAPEELEAYFDEHKSWGYDVVRVDRTEMADIEPSLDSARLPDWAILSGQEGAMEADQVALQLIENAKTEFGSAVVHATVDGFLKNEDGSIGGIITSSAATSSDSGGSNGAGKNVIRADHVVLAGGLGSVPLLEAENVDLPVSGREGLLINTRPVKSGVQLLNTLYNGRELHMRQTSEGRIRSGKDYQGGDTGETPEDAAAALFAKVQQAFRNKNNSSESAVELEYDYYTIGVRPDPADGMPILGPSGLQGLTVTVMHSGVTNAAVVGELLAELVLKGVSDPLLYPYRLSRFSESS